MDKICKQREIIMNINLKKKKNSPVDSLYFEKTVNTKWKFLEALWK